MSSDEYFVSKNELLHKVVREEDKISLKLVVPASFGKYVLHQTHEALVHIRTTRAYQCLKGLYCWKGLGKDIDIQVKQCINCRQCGLHPQCYA